MSRSHAHGGLTPEAHLARFELLGVEHHGHRADRAIVALQRRDVHPDRPPAERGHAPGRRVVANGVTDERGQRGEVRLDVEGRVDDAAELVVDGDASIGTREPLEHTLDPAARAAQDHRLHGFAHRVGDEHRAPLEILLESRTLFADLVIGEPADDEEGRYGDSDEQPDQ